jgi:hypothetical protein
MSIASRAATGDQRAAARLSQIRKSVDAVDGVQTNAFNAGGLEAIGKAAHFVQVFVGRALFHFGPGLIEK